MFLYRRHRPVGSRLRNAITRRPSPGPSQISHGAMMMMAAPVVSVEVV
jgi:hypothetical protein